MVPKDRKWWASFAVLIALGSLWSLASPLLSVPDEPAHVIKAAAVARGQVRSPEALTPSGPLSKVEVPEILARTFGSPCYAFQPDVSVQCAEPLQGSTDTVDAYTSAGRYPPMYYYAVGLPSLAFPSAAGIHLMRLVSVVLSAAFIASSFASAREATRSGSLVVGVAVAVTPMVLYLAASVNPNGLEIAAAIGLWASLLVLGLGRRFIPSARLGVRIALAAGALALSRPLSPLWLGMIALIVLAMVNRERLGAMVRSPVIWGLAVVGGLCVLASGIWIAQSGALELLVGGTAAEDAGYTAILRRSMGSTGNEMLHMIGTFGWLDTAAPLATYYAWFACLGFLAFASLVYGRRSHKLVLAALVLFVLAVPRVIEASQARSLGYVWQGRYTLPLAVGVPMVAALLATDLWATMGGRLVRPFVGAMVGGHVLAFLWAMRRNAVGVSGPLLPVDWPDPAASIGLLAMFVVASGLYGWVVICLAAPQAEEDSHPAMRA